MRNILCRVVVFFLMMTLLGYAQKNNEQPSREEQTRDVIVVHGMVLRGRVTNIGPEKLSFKLQYSDGTNRISYKDIDSIYTKYNYHISFKRINIIGRIVGIEDSEYLKIMEGNKERTVKIADIDGFVMAVSEDASFENMVRNKFPYTKGSIHAGFESESGNNKKNNANLLLNLKRKEAQHEVRLYVDYEFETTQTAENTSKVQNKDDLIAVATYKNYFENNQFFFAALAAEYDRPRQIQQRWLPSLGYGYKFTFDKSIWLEPAVGLAYATTSYTDNEYPEEQFNAAALRLTGEYLLDDLSYISSMIIDGSVMYYPSLTEPDAHWILRSNLGFTIPLFDFLSLRFGVDYINDSNPDPAVGNNKTTSKLLFGFDF